MIRPAAPASAIRQHTLANGPDNWAEASQAGSSELRRTVRQNEFPPR